MDLPWDYQLREDQRPNPVVYAAHVDLTGVPVPSDADLQQIFRTSGYGLQTWARSVDAAGRTVLVDDPHWIAVRGDRKAPLHIDPKYPRYSHHLKVRVDPGIAVRGLDKTETPLTRGLFYVLDTHSPHQVVFNQRSGWNVAASIDHPTVLDPASTIARLLAYVRSRPCVTPADALQASRKAIKPAPARPAVVPVVIPEAFPVLVQTCAGREPYVTELLAQLPVWTTVVKDEHEAPAPPGPTELDHAYATWLRVLRMAEAAGDRGTLCLEDDVVLVPNFVARARAVVALHGASVVNFFSTRTVRGGYLPAAQYQGNLAYWLPAGVAAQLAAYATASPLRELDGLVRQFLVDRQQRFYQVVPNLVDHRVGPSAILHDPPRRHDRRSKTFDASAG